MKKKFSIFICFLLLFQGIFLPAAFAEETDEAYNWYIGTTGEKITAETTEAYITTEAPAAENEPILALRSNKDGGSQIYWIFDEPIDGSFAVKMDYYFENAGGFGFSFLTSEGATATTAQVFQMIRQAAVLRIIRILLYHLRLQCFMNLK